MRGAATILARMTALAALVVGGAAFAQSDTRALRERSEILQQQDIARQDALAAQRQASAAQSRYDTQLTLRALDATSNMPAQPSLRPSLSPIPPRGPSPGDLAADMARMDSLTDARLAEGNARLRAATPAY